MDALTNGERGNRALKKTLLLDSRTVEMGEEMATADHRGCLSNEIKWLVATEYARRAAGKPEAGR